MKNKEIHIIGGGTFEHVRTHLSLAAPAFGTTAKKLFELCYLRFENKMDINLHLTKMADSRSSLVENDDIEKLVDKLIADLNVKVIFFNVALCDYAGFITEESKDIGKLRTGEIKKILTNSGKYKKRLQTSHGSQNMHLATTKKIINKIRSERKDIFLIGFKTTSDLDENKQYFLGLKLLKENSCNLVLANDVVRRMNMIITPEETRYHVTSDRHEVLKQLVDMVFHRCQLSFTKSTVINGELVNWDSPQVYSSLRTVVNHCIEKGAYKEFLGSTVGHFACKIGEKEFLTSIRKSNFNNLSKTGLVKVTTDNDDTVIAYGAKPSVGGQSQRIIFSEHNDYDCIVHFHCPIKQGSEVPVVSQREYECGSHQCGKNTSNGLKRFGNLSAVMLDQHGPNIVFHHSIDAREVIDFIDKNFDLSEKT
jgi:hypothetical protein